MSEDKLIEKARTFAKSGQLQRAKDILEALDSERAKSLLNKVNLALAAQSQPVPSKAPQKPKIAPKETKAAKPKQKTNPAIAVIALLVICGACYFSIQSANQPANYGNSPEDKVRAAVADSFGAQAASDISSLVVNDIVVTVAFPLSNLSEYFATEDARLNMPKLVCELRGRGFTNRRYQLTGTVESIDAFGNEGMADGVEVILEPATIAAINCASADDYGINLEAIAESYTVFPILR